MNLNFTVIFFREPSSLYINFQNRIWRPNLLTPLTLPSERPLGGCCRQWCRATTLSQFQRCVYGWKLSRQLLKVDILRSYEVEWVSLNVVGRLPTSVHTRHASNCMILFDGLMDRGMDGEATDETLCFEILS